jgi:hypothetical protein
MKISGLGVGLLLGSLASVSAQVTVEVTQDQDQFLQGEALPVAVRITNRSGEPLHLGADADWLTFSIESRDAFVVPKNGEAPVAGEFVLESSKVAIKRVDLAPYFNLPQPGRYGIVANVHIKDWNRDVTSPPRYFNVIEGAKFWEQEVGVPNPAAAGNAPPEVRKYMLQQVNYIKGQLRLYLRLTDGYGRTLRVFPIGPMVSFGRPDPQVDRLSRLHVLYQNGAYSFSYTIFNLNGDVVTHQTYDYISTRPRLRTDDDGNISVIGGTRRITDNDVPPPDPNSATNASPASALPATNTVAKPAVSNTFAPLKL